MELVQDPSDLQTVLPQQSLILAYIPSSRDSQIAQIGLRKTPSAADGLSPTQGTPSIELQPNSSAAGSLACQVSDSQVHHGPTSKWEVPAQRRSRQIQREYHDDQCRCSQKSKSPQPNHQERFNRNGVLKPSTADEDHILRTLQKKQRLVSALRENTLTARMQVNQQRQRCSQLREYADESQIELADAVDTAIAGKTLQDGYVVIKQRSKKFRKAIDELRSQELHTKDLEHHLTSSEARLGREEAALFKQLSGVLHGTLREFTSVASVVTSTSASSSDGVPSILHEYWDKTGDVGIWQERLHELEYEHNQESIARETRFTLGQKVDPPELDFIDGYNQQREGLLQQLVSTEIESRRLREDCISRGLDPDSQVQDGNWPKPSPNGSRPTPTGEAFISRPVTGYETTRERIEKWLVGMQANDLECVSSRNTRVVHLRPPASSQITLNQLLRGRDQRRGGAELFGGVSKEVSVALSPRSSREHLLATSWIGDAPQRRYSNPLLRSEYQSDTPSAVKRARSIR